MVGRNMHEPQKIIKVGNSLALVISAQVCRDLNIRRGDYFDLFISDRNIMVARRLKILAEGEFGEARDFSVPVIKQNE